MALDIMGANSEPSVPISVVRTGTAKEGTPGPPIGNVDIGVCESAYLFRVALPGVRKDDCELSCEVERDGNVHVQGVVTGGELAKKNSVTVHQVRVIQLCPPGPFSISFKLPGPVDPRLFTPNFRSDGIFEGVVMRYGASDGPFMESVE